MGENTHAKGREESGGRNCKVLRGKRLWDFGGAIPHFFLCVAYTQSSLLNENWVKETAKVKLGEDAIFFEFFS